MNWECLECGVANWIDTEVCESCHAARALSDLKKALSWLKPIYKEFYRDEQTKTEEEFEG